ncbi:MAG: hypothetical protein ACWA41_05565 [Putridiphycobacter sp.]
MKLLTLLFLLLFSAYGISQSFKNSFAIDYYFTPILVAETSINYGFVSPQKQQIDSVNVMFFRKHRFKKTLNLSYSRIYASGFQIITSINFSRITPMGNRVSESDTSVFYYAKKYYSNWLSLNLNFAKAVEMDEKVTFIHGIVIGGGLLSNNNDEIKGVYSKGIPKFQDEIEFDHVETFHTGVKPSLLNFNLRYDFTLEFKAGKNISLFTGFKIPIIRLFTYNDISFQPGVKLNTDSFFTSYNSYSVYTNNVESFNKNLAFSLKKNQAFGLKLGIKYYW